MLIQHPMAEMRTPQPNLSNNSADGLLTPPSSASFSSYSRRDSVNSWTARSLTGASSISFSPQQPSTPIRRRGCQDEFIMAGNLGLQDEEMDKHFATPMGPEYEIDIQYSTDWSVHAPPDIYDDQSLHQSFLPETNDWQTPGIVHSQQFPSKDADHETVGQENPHSTSWPVVQGFQDVDITYGLPSINGPYPSVASSVHVMPNIPFRSVVDFQQVDFASQQTTVVPSQTFVEVDPDAESNAALFGDSDHPSSVLTFLDTNDYKSNRPWPLDSSPELKTEDAKCCGAHREPTPADRIRETSTGAKGVKKGRKTQRCSNRNTKSKKDTMRIPGRDFQLEINPELCRRARERGPEGKIETNAYKKLCGWPLGSNRVCEKPFTRPEHWKRHWFTHTQERPFECVVEGCTQGEGDEKRQKAFGRADNRCAHYVTHLIRKAGSRNILTSLEYLCERIRIKEPKEEAEKTIKKLEKVMAEERRKAEATSA